MTDLLIACVQVGDYCDRGEEYLRKLAAAVNRHLDQPYEMVCVSDKEMDVPGVTRIPANPDLRGWWQKMMLFCPRFLPDARRVVYMDLDTVLVSDITSLVEYDGPFAMIENFYDPGYGSGLMSWPSGFGERVWENYERQGKPQQGGDQGFISQASGGAVKLQTVVPGIYSYKVHCQNEAPEDASVVCFHGRPRPHEVNGWVLEHWRE